MIVNENNKLAPPDLKSLQACLAKMISIGYTEDFKAEENGLRALRNDRLYQPQDVNIVNFYRFEGPSNPDDMSIMYAIGERRKDVGVLCKIFHKLTFSADG